MYFFSGFLNGGPGPLAITPSGCPPVCGTSCSWYAAEERNDGICIFGLSCSFGGLEGPGSAVLNFLGLV